MPSRGKLWRHVIINTRCTWLHGDVRGFRSRGHRVHSSGDYKQRPPLEEHEGLREFHERRSATEVHLSHDQRAVIGREIVCYLQEQQHRVLVVAVTKVHAHVLVELPGAMADVKGIIGNAKRRSSKAVKHALPGSIWAAGGKYKRVLDCSHGKSAFEYILYDQGPTAWTWSYKDVTTDGQYARRRPA